MLESNQLNPVPGRRPPALVHAAKWPPDDGDVPAMPPGGGLPGGGSFDTGGGDFKKGRFNPWVILVGVVGAITLAVFLALGVKQDEERLTVEQAEEQKKAIFVLPKAEQIPHWRKWAASEASSELQAEALKQLAWAGDPEGVKLAVDALKSPSVPVKGMAATALAEYGTPAADSAKDPLLTALKSADAGAKPQIAWALVVLGEARAFDEIMNLYRLGHLSQVQRLGGGLAFDPNRMIRLVSLDKIASMAGDESPAVRQLVATVLSGNAEPKFTDPLIKLLGDEDGE
ncbi:MAG TPA: HEAT repeat domain-containing protein, partial [Polyangiaceae bacterium]